jgi:hypothetical protein
MVTSTSASGISNGNMTNPLKPEDPPTTMRRRPLAQINIKMSAFLKALLQKETVRLRFRGDGEGQTSGSGLVNGQPY